MSHALTRLSSFVSSTVVIHFESRIPGVGHIIFETLASTTGSSHLVGVPVALTVLSTEPSSASCCVTGIEVQE